MSWYHRQRKIMAYESSKKSIKYSIITLLIIEWIIYGLYINEKNTLSLFLCMFLGTTVIHLLLIRSGIIFHENTYGGKTLIKKKDRKIGVLAFFLFFYIPMWIIIFSSSFLDILKNIIEISTNFEEHPKFINGLLSGFFLILTTFPFLFINGIFFLMSEKSQSKMGRSDEE